MKKILIIILAFFVLSVSSVLSQGKDNGSDYGSESDTILTASDLKAIDSICAYITAPDSLNENYEGEVLFLKLGLELLYKNKKRELYSSQPDTDSHIKYINGRIDIDLNDSVQAAEILYNVWLFMDVFTFSGGVEEEITDKMKSVLQSINHCLFRREKTVFNNRNDSTAVQVVIP